MSNEREKEAYGRMMEHLRKLEEEAIYLGTHRSDGRWAKMATLWQQQREMVTQLAMNRKLAH